MRSALLALLLAGCGGAAKTLPVGPPESGIVRVVAVTHAELAPGDQGGYLEGGLIVVRGDILAGVDLPRLVLAHELGHALGLQHSDDPSCLMLARPQQVAAALCPAEEAHARSFPGSLSVVCPDLAIRPHLLAACGLWNGAAGRVILALD